MIKLFNLEWVRLISSKCLTDKEEELIARKVEKFLLTLNIKCDY